MSAIARIVTPAEYADAYALWRKQTSAVKRDEVAAVLEPHLIALQAEAARQSAIRRWADTPTKQAERWRALQLGIAVRRAS